VESAPNDKINALQSCGIAAARTPAEMGETLVGLTK
jgi:hypothetical protein